MSLSKSEISQLEDAKTVGGSPSVTLTDGEMVNLFKLVSRDLGFEVPDELACNECDNLLDSGFYDVDIDNFDCDSLGWVSTTEGILHDFISDVTSTYPDVFTYYSSLVQLHSYRRKFRLVNISQDIPDLEGIIPQGLLELGDFDAESIVTWMIWRKFLYDLDNRSAQNTGYVFEPILTKSIGGTSFSSSESPIERTNRSGSRQVDCIVDDYAYEFKKRMTIAASGQGRFGEELQFAEDASNSGYTPVLLVLDPTPSAKLEKLSEEYRNYGGAAYVGDEAWDHLETRAGEVMSEFLEKYVRQPISRIDDNEDRFDDLTLKYEEDSDGVVVEISGEDIRLR